MQRNRPKEFTKLERKGKKVSTCWKSSKLETCRIRVGQQDYLIGLCHQIGPSTYSLLLLNPDLSVSRRKNSRFAK